MSRTRSCTTQPHCSSSGRFPGVLSVRASSNKPFGKTRDEPSRMILLFAEPKRIIFLVMERGELFRQRQQIGGERVEDNCFSRFSVNWCTGGLRKSPRTCSDPALPGQANIDQRIAAGIHGVSTKIVDRVLDSLASRPRSEWMRKSSAPDHAPAAPLRLNTALTSLSPTPILCAIWSSMPSPTWLSWQLV